VRRRRRLRSPAVAFSVIGLLGLYAASVPGTLLRGGLAGNGLYLLALQFVASAMAMSAIDDSRDPQLADAGSEPWWRTNSPPPGLASFQLRRALLQFYLWYPMAACLLAWGLSISLSFIAIGILDRGLEVDDGFGPALDAPRVHDSEVALGSLLVLTVLLTLSRRGLGRYGWVVGFAMGVVVTQVTLNVSASDSGTAANWALLGAGLIALSVIYAVAQRLLGRRRRTEPA
jgi:hypothetical protein